MVRRQSVNSMKSAMKAVSIKDSDPVLDENPGRSNGERHRAKPTASQETR